LHHLFSTNPAYEFSLPVEEVFSYFQTPADWARLYGLAGDVKDLGGGWYAVPLKRFPFPLVARNTEQRANELARWMFKGFWRGKGEVRFTEGQAMSGKSFVQNETGPPESDGPKLAAFRNSSQLIP
jgi:hypothetical protein